MTDKYKELRDFIFYHLRNNRKIKLIEIIPLMNQFLRNIGEPPFSEDKPKKEKKRV